MKWIVFVVAISYSFLRYAWAMETPIENWPAFISNKALAFSAVSFLTLGFWTKLKKQKDASEFFYLSLVCAISHGAISAAILNPSYYEFLYNDVQRLNIWGEMTILFGAVAFALFISWSREFASFSRDIFVFSIILCHIVSVGYSKWITPSLWKYGLVPISLLSASIIFAGLVIRVRHRPK